MIIYQIVPKLPPAINGVGDYALKLALQLRKDFSLNSHFIIGDPQWKGTEEVEGFTLTKIQKRSAKKLFAAIPTNSQTNTIVLLHYVGYGYAKRGCPLWLLNGLELWKNQNPKLKLVIMFHEIYAFYGPFWTSVFWLSSLQKYICKCFLKLSDCYVTNRNGNAIGLKNLVKNKEITIDVLPVFSNVDEPVSSPNLRDREKILVVFGQNRISTYTECAQIVKQVCTQLNIKEIWDIGPITPLISQINEVAGVPVVLKGALALQEVSKIMLSCLAGFMNYDPDYLARSGIFAAYCAHRMLPINARATEKMVDGIIPGQHYWVPDSKRISSVDEMEQIADNSYKWYSQHSLSVQAGHFFSCFQYLSTH